VPDLLPVLQDNDAYRALAGKHEMLTLTDFTAPDTAADAIVNAYAALAADADGLRARLMAEAEAYSWDSVAESYFRLYEKVLA
jgi:alpha-1,3-mannosyltransferase